MAPPINVQDWYGDRHTCQIASGALAGCMKTIPVHQHLETQTETETQEHIYQKPARYVHELKWHLIEIWSSTSRA